MQYRLPWREWLSHKVYPILFSLSLILALGAYLTLDTLQVGVRDYIDANQKELVGGDVVVQSRQAFSDELLSSIEALPDAEIVYDYQFNAIAYTDDDSLLTRIKAVTSAYPLYGTLELASGRSMAETSQPKMVWVEEQVLASLKVKVGDRIRIGETYFTIADEIVAEPDRPLTAFGFGARILMQADDLQATGLMGQRSRINYRAEIKLPQEQVLAVTQQLQQLTPDRRVQVRNAEDADTSISVLSGNFLRFLKLLVIAVIVLSAIGLTSVVKSFLNLQYDTIAVRRTLGESTNSIVGGYRWMLLLMALIGVVLATLVSYAVLYFGGDAFSAILPDNLTLGLSLWSVAKTALIAVLLCWLITGATLQRLHAIKPVAILHKHTVKPKTSIWTRLWFLASVIGVWVLLYSELDAAWDASLIMLGMVLVWLILYVFNHLFLKLVRAYVPRHWLLRLGLQNVFRKGAQSGMFISVMALTIMILWIITLLDYSINDQLISSYPEDAPNFFLLDVQLDQQEELNDMIPADMIYYPVVRARLESVNGIAAETLKDQLGRYDDITRVFNLSYGTELLPTERITTAVQGDQFFAETGDSEVVPLSILNSIAEYLQVGLGDRIVFNIQGVPIETEVTSVRQRLKRGPSPFFYFIFPPEVLADAPQIRFATTRLQDSDRVRLQTEIAQKFPGITTLDGDSIAKQLKKFVDQLKQLVQIFTALSLFAGLLIFAASLISTSQDRYRESSYYRLMGMQQRDLYALSWVEFIFLGFVSLLIGSVLAAVISWLIVTRWFAIAFSFPFDLLGLAALAFAAFMTLVSVFYTRRVLQTKPLDYVRADY